MGRFHGSSCASSTREDAVLRKDNGDFKKAFRPASEFSTLDFKPETSGDDALSEILTPIVSATVTKKQQSN